MAATFKCQICYNVDLAFSDEEHKLLVGGDPAATRAAVIHKLEDVGQRAHTDSITSAAITVLVSLKNGPQKILFQNETTKAIIRT